MLQIDARFQLSRMLKPKEGYTLSMDRTNWQFGRKHINFLVVSVVAGTVAVPLFWKVLPKKNKAEKLEHVSTHCIDESLTVGVASERHLRVNNGPRVCG